MKNNEIMVVCDMGQCDSGHILQIISKAKSLADQVGYKTVALCIGDCKEDGLARLAEYGADTILFHRYTGFIETGVFADIVDQVLSHREPEVVLFPASDIGKAVAATMSVRFGAGLTADCVDIEVTEEKEFLFVRAAINNSVLAKIKCVNSEMKMSTIKKDVFTRKKSPADKVVIKPIALSRMPEERRNVKLLETIKRESKSKSVDIGRFSVVFCIGRGVSDTATRDRIDRLAKTCGAVLVGTRAVVEEDLVDKEYQIGQSGKSIAPRVYVGFGVSGASQHMVGIRNSDIIIAVNNDENAAIFDYADYVIVEDLKVVIDEMESILLEKELVSA